MKLKEKPISESSVFGKGTTVADNVIENVAVLGPTSPNGKGRDYTKRYMESAKPLYEGIAVTVMPS